VRSLDVNGEAIVVRPLKAGQIPAFLRAITPALRHFAALEIDWLGLLGQRGDDLLAALALAVGKPREWVNDLSADQAIGLAAQVIEVNADFLSRTVIPTLDGLFLATAHIPVAPLPEQG
jgi:hypothetical protein